MLFSGRCGPSAGAALVQGSAPAHADLISALGAGPYDALPLPGLTGYGYHLFNATKDSVTGDISNLPAWASVTTTGTAAAGATLLDITYGPPGFLGHGRHRVGGILAVPRCNPGQHCRRGHRA